jgi:RNA polymerase sigma-70 factor (ECF subfamily)
MNQQKRLITRYNQGDNRALHEIYILYKDDLTGFACALLHDKTAAEDVVHDVFAALIANQNRLRITCNLRQYLLTSVINSVRNRHRVKVRSANVSLDSQTAFEPKTDDLPEDGIFIGERRQQLAAALQELPCDQREVLLLRHFADLKFKDIAKAQNVSINTVQGRYRYGLEKLRALLNRELE